MSGWWPSGVHGSESATEWPFYRQELLSGKLDVVTLSPATASAHLRRTAHDDDIMSLGTVVMHTRR